MYEIIGVMLIIDKFSSFYRIIFLHLILVSVGYDQLTKSQILESKVKNWSSSVFYLQLTSSSLARCNGNIWWQKTNFSSGYGFQILTIKIRVLLCLRFLHSLAARYFLFKLINPIHFILIFYFLTHNLMVWRLLEIKEKKY